MIHNRRIRAARALLNWIEADLARAAGMATSSIKSLGTAAVSARRESLLRAFGGLDSYSVARLTDAGARDGIRAWEGDTCLLNGPESDISVPRPCFKCAAGVHRYRDQITGHRGLLRRCTVVLEMCPLVQHLNELFNLPRDQIASLPCVVDGVGTTVTPLRLPHSALQAAASEVTIPGWRLTPAQRAEIAARVTIRVDRIASLLPWLQPEAPNEAWRTYVGPVDPANPDLARLFYEMALTISQFGGFVAFRGDGDLVTWKHDGSGVKAILTTMARVRDARKLPQIDLKEDLEHELAPYFIRTTFGKERLDMLLEVGQPQSLPYFARLLRLARRRDGSYRFDVLHMKGLACRFPRAFGSDPVFYKKASLLLMTMEIALKQLGQEAMADTLPPADYRIPQILEGLGILQFRDDLNQKLVAGHVFRLDDPDVRAIRAMTVEAVVLIKEVYERHHQCKVSCAELDGLLYLLSRNRPLMRQTTMKPHMLVTTHAF